MTGEERPVTFDSVGIVGGGAWGTALAQTLRLAGRDVVLWAREAEVVAEINAAHTNTAFLPGVALDAGLRATADLADIAARDVVLMVAPAQHVRRVAAEIGKHLRDGKPVVICAKGLEQATGKLLGQVLGETLPQATQAVLSGPSFAADVARGLPAALTLATADEALGQALAAALADRQLPHLLGERYRRRAARRRGEERAGDRRRHRRGPGARRQRARRPRHPRLRRAQALRRRARRQARDADGPLRPRRSPPHLRQPPVAQHEPRPRARPGAEPGGRARQPPLRGRGRLHRRRRRRVAAEQAIDMPISQAVPPSSPAASPSTTPSTPCCRGRRRAEG